MKSIAVWHPSNDSEVVGQWANGISLYFEVLLACLRVADQESVYKSKKLHDTFILSKILVPFQEKHVVIPVTSSQSNFTGALFAGNHVYIRNKLVDFNIGPVNPVGAWNTKLETAGTI